MRLGNHEAVETVEHRPGLVPELRDETRLPVPVPPAGTEKDGLAGLRDPAPESLAALPVADRATDEVAILVLPARNAEDRLGRLLRRFHDVAPGLLHRVHDARDEEDEERGDEEREGDGRVVHNGPLSFLSVFELQIRRS